MGLIEPAKVVAEIVKFTKYVYNLEAIATAMTLVVRTPFDVEEATLAAFGQRLPLQRVARPPTSGAVHVSGGTAVSALTSRDYLVHRDSITSQLLLIRNKIDAFIDTVSTLDSSLDGQLTQPFVFSNVTSLASLATGAEIITQSPDEFELTIQLDNMSATVLSNITARLVVDSPKNSITMTTPNDVVVGSVAGGANTAAVWRFSYSGDLSDELIGLRIELLENDVTPTSFDFNEPHTSIFVDPAIFDQAFSTRTTVHVVDVAYPDNAPQEFSVIVVGDNAPMGSTTTTTMPMLECGDATGDGIVTASDALASLQGAVGLISCPLNVCDVNGDGRVTAIDALTVLKFAVGVAVTLNCAG